MTDETALNDLTIPNAFGVIPEDEALDKEAHSTGREAVRSTFAIMVMNSRDWQNYEEFLNTPAGLISFWSSDRHPSELMREPMKLLMNFLTSASALTDHTRNHVRRVYGTHSFFREYEKEVQRLFLTGLPRFVGDLRNFTLHYSLPLSKARIQLASPPSHQFVLTKARLTNSGYSWNKDAQHYLDEQQEDLPVGSIVSEYVALTTSFYRWREEREQELFQRIMLAQHGPNSRVARAARGEVVNDD